MLHLCNSSYNFVVFRLKPIFVTFFEDGGRIAWTSVTVAVSRCSVVRNAVNRCPVVRNSVYRCPFVRAVDRRPVVRTVDRRPVVDTESCAEGWVSWKGQISVILDPEIIFCIIFIFNTLSSQFRYNWTHKLAAYAYDRDFRINPVHIYFCFCTNTM